MEENVQSCEELAELARICARNARLATSKAVASELWRMAKEYQAKAAKLSGGGQLELGDPPAFLTT